MSSFKSLSNRFNSSKKHHTESGLSEEDLQLINAIDKGLVPISNNDSLELVCQRYTVKFFIVNTIFATEFSQQALDKMMRRGKTAEGIEQMYEEILMLAIEGSCSASLKCSSH